LHRTANGTYPLLQVKEDQEATQLKLMQKEPSRKEKKSPRRGSEGHGVGPNLVRLRWERRERGSFNIYQLEPEKGLGIKLSLKEKLCGYEDLHQGQSAEKRRFVGKAVESGRHWQITPRRKVTFR